MSSIKQKISTITKNKEAKTVASNFMWLSLLQVASYAFPLITTPYLARVIGVEGFGKIAFAASIMVWIRTIADWGFNQTATRDVAQNRDNLEKISEIFSNVLWARILLMFLSLCFLLILIAVIPQLRDDYDIILITFLMVPGHILFPGWFFQAMEKMKYTTILNTLIKLLFTLLVFIFIRESEDYILQPLLNAIGYIICGLIAMFIIINQWGIKLRLPRFKNIFQTLKRSIDMFISNLAPNLYDSFSITLLGIFGGGTASGIYDGGNKFIYICQQLLHTVERAFFPFISRRIDKHSIFCKINLTISLLIALLLWIGAPILIKFFLTPEFAESVYVIRIRAISLIFWTISSIYGRNYLLILHKESLLRKITLNSSIVAFIAAWPLVYFYGYIGTAISVTFGFGLIALFTCLTAKKQTMSNYR